MSASGLQIGIDFQVMIAHPRAPGDPEPEARRSSPLRQLLNRDSAVGTKWPSEKLIFPIHDDQFGFPAKRCIWKVCDVLASAGFPVACSYPLNPRRGEPLTTEMNKVNTSVVTGRNGRQYRTWNDPEAFHLESPRDRCWFITHELGVTGLVKTKLGEESPLGYKWYCIGIKAPLTPMKSGKGSGDLLPLRSAFQVLKSALKIWTNNLCAMSFQVSQIDGTLTGMTAKKAAALTALLEAPLLSKFFDPRRMTDGEISFISTQCRIAGGQWNHVKEDVDSRRLAQHLANRHSTDSRTKGQGGDALHLLLHRILTQVDVQSLHNGLQQDNGTHCSFNVTTDCVLEFSYPETSFETEFIAVWADIVRRTVEIAISGEDQYEKILDKLIDLRSGVREIGWINYWDTLGVRDKDDRGSRMWWVRSIANGYMGREKVNGFESL